MFLIKQEMGVELLTKYKSSAILELAIVYT